MDDNPLIFAEDSYDYGQTQADILSSPGNDSTSVPSSDPWGSLSGAFGTAAGAIQSGVSTYLGIVNAKNAATMQINQARASADLAAARLQAQSAIDAARISSQTAIAKQQFARMPSLTALFGGTSAPGTTDYAMLGLMAVSVYFGWKAIKGHK